MSSQNIIINYVDDGLIILDIGIDVEPWRLLSICIFIYGIWTSDIAVETIVNVYIYLLYLDKWHYRGDAAEILSDHVTCNDNNSPDLRIIGGLE